MKQLYFNLLLFFALFGSTQVGFAQQNHGTIKGKVLTIDYKPAENVSIALKGTNYGTITGDNGEYAFKAPAGTYTLVISFVGVQSVENTVEIQAGKTVTVSAITINTSGAALQEVNVNSAKTNKFAHKRSDDVAKMPLTNLENPQVYSTVTKELLQEQLVYSVDDATRNAPGLQKMWEATGRGGDGGSYYTMRGFVTQSMLRNGIAGNVTSTIDAANLERIEVIKGPSSTLFGSSLTSYGGLINRITKKAYDYFGGEVAYSAGSYGFNRVSADINTPLDVQKKVLFRLNTAYNYKNSFQDKGFNQNIVVAPTLTYNVNDKLSITADAELYYGRMVNPTNYFVSSTSGLGTNTVDGLNFDYKKSYLNSDLSEKNRSTNFFVQADYKISKQWTSSTNFSSTNSFSDGFAPYYYILTPDSISRNDQSTINSKDHTIEIQENINGDFKIGSLRNRVVIGLDYFRRNSNQVFQYGGFDEVSLLNPSYTYGNFNKANLTTGRDDKTLYSGLYPIIFKSNTYSAYVSDVLNITDNLLALASLRVDYYDNKGAYSATGTQTTPSYNQTAFSPKFGLVYQPVKDVVSLFGNYQNGFKNPGFYTAYDAATAALANKQAKIEQAEQLEGGVKLDAFGGKLSSTLTYYHIKLTDVLRTDPAHAALYAQLQDGTQFSQGMEAEVIANPFVGFNAVVGFAYNNSKFENASTDVNGRRPSTSGSPYLANLWLSYRIQQGTVKGLGFGFGGNYASENKILNSASAGVFSLPAYTILNASTFYDTKKLRLGVKVDNLTNKKYYIGYDTINPQQLISVIGSVAFKF